MSVYDPDRFSHKLICTDGEGPLEVVVTCSRCSKSHVRKIIELMVDPVNICGCDYDLVKHCKANIVNRFEPYYMDYRILTVKGQLGIRHLDESKRRIRLENYVKLMTARELNSKC